MSSQPYPFSIYFVISLCVIFALFLLWILFFPQYRPCLFRSRLLPNKNPPSPEEEQQRTNNNNISDADQEEDKELLSWIHQRSRDRFGVQAQPQAPPAPPATLTKQPTLRGQPKPVKMGLGLGFIAPPQTFAGEQRSSLIPHIAIKSPPQIFTSAAYATPQHQIRWTPPRLPSISLGKEREGPGIVKREETYSSFSAQNVRDSLELEGKKRRERV